jgi:hypothetical protein
MGRVQRILRNRLAYAGSLQTPQLGDEKSLTLGRYAGHPFTAGILRNARGLFR